MTCELNALLDAEAATRPEISSDGEATRAAGERFERKRSMVGNRGYSLDAPSDLSQPAKKTRYAIASLAVAF
jgi:hypothetical protein